MKKIYPLAAHSYFTITNKADQKRRFLRDNNYQLQFMYQEHFDATVVQGHLGNAQHEASKQSLQLVLASIVLQEETPSKETLDSFRSINEQLFKAPDPAYVQAILARVQSRVTPKTAHLWQYVLEHVDYNPALKVSVMPDHATFRKYHDYFQKYYQSIAITGGDLIGGLERALERTGLATQGWQVRLLDDAVHARIDHRRKRVVVGEHYHPRTSKAAERIIVHEVVGHAVRGLQENMSESEGVAVLFEQLLAPRFKFRRTYRYLAASLGWGEAGGPRTFREVYEIIWRLMVITSRYSEENAKSHAFDECVRVFRGGRPDIAGMVFLKDTVYFAANVRVWQQLKREPLAYNEFVDIIEGRRKVLQ